MAAVVELIRGDIMQNIARSVRNSGVFLFFAVALVFASSSSVEAKYASIVVDFESGKVLYEKNADTRNYPASLTKMMTLYMLFDALDKGQVTLETRMPVSARAAGMAPTKLGLPKGSSIAVEDAILALAVKSANDVATVVAEHLGGTEIEFARMMTAKARGLGMDQTTFRNASGLPNRGQLSTARDMARLSAALIRHFPDYYAYFSYSSFEYNGRTYRGHNNLLDDYDGADGIKTGYIRASGFNLAASVMRDDRRLIAVVFGGRTARSRDAHMVELLDRGYVRAAALDVPPPAPGLRNPFREPTAIAQTRSEPQSVQIASTEPAETSFSLIPSAKAAETGGSWAVQVGAFHSYAPAEAMAQTAVQRVPDLAQESKIEIPSAEGNQGTLYRARLSGFSEGLAREACRRLEAAEMDCLVVKGGS